MRSSTLKDQEEFVFVELFDIQDVLVHGREDEDTKKGFGFHLTKMHKKKQYIFYSSTKAEQEKWLDSILKCRVQLISKRRRRELSASPISMIRSGS